MSNRPSNLAPIQTTLERFRFSSSKLVNSQIAPVSTQLSLFRYLEPVQRPNMNLSSNIPAEEDVIEIEMEKDQPPQEVEEIPIKKKVGRPKIIKKNAEDEGKKRNPNRALHNQSYAYKLKYDVMKDLKSYIDNETKQKSIVQFCGDLEKKYGVKSQTAREYYYKVKKDPTIVDKVQGFCSNEKFSFEKGHVERRKKASLACSEEIEMQIVDWITICNHVGIIVTPKMIIKKAKELVPAETFKASFPWLRGFYKRHGLSLRTITTSMKSLTREEEEKEMMLTFISEIKNLIIKYNILPRDIINADETPMFWEYLPRKIVYSRGTKEVPSWKTSYNHKRTTLLLACNLQGDMLRPTIVLKRKTAYKLQCENKIKLFVQNSDSGWTTASTFTQWITEIIAPHLQNRHGILLIDSYEGHKSDDIRLFVNKNYPNIHCCIIPGGYTHIMQPLDMGINAYFKRFCKEESLNFTNNQIFKLQEEAQENPQKINLRLMIGNILV